MITFTSHASAKILDAEGSRHGAARRSAKTLGERGESSRPKKCSLTAIDLPQARHQG
ncbi:hypothetical protein ACU4HD_47560 [Cupriavidus basilensis]